MAKVDAIELIAAVVEGPFETPLWGTFLDRLRVATGADYAVLNFRPPGRPYAEAITLISGAQQVDMEEAIRDRLPPGDPPIAENLIEGRPYSLNELFAAHMFPRAELYQEFLTQNGITAILQMRVQEPSGVHAWLDIVRAGGKDFDVEHIDLVASLARFLRTALRNYVTAERRGFEAALTSQAIRRVFGWLTLDGNGQVLDLDEQAVSVLANSGVLGKTANGKLFVRPPSLEREIYEALRRISADPQCRPQAFTLNRDPWLDMLIVPARSKSISAKATPTAVAYVHGDSWRAADRGEQLAQLFRLSPGEARLALALCRGMTIAEAAEEFGLAVGTARNYCKTIFAKTGARGQPDLVRIVMRSVLAIAPDI